MEWPTAADVPDEITFRRGLRGKLFPVFIFDAETADPDRPDDPFLAGVYEAASWAYTGIFGPILGPMLFDGAVFTPDPDFGGT